MSIGGSILDWPNEIGREFDDILDISQRETGEAISAGIDDLFRATRSLSLDLLKR